jgi:translation initiation factor IF-3
MKGPRVNNKIRANEVQLITHDGDNIGVVPIGEALDRAREVGLDLIEVAPNVKPPVCKIIDYGKYKYEIQKKQVRQRRNKKLSH